LQHWNGNKLTLNGIQLTTLGIIHNMGTSLNGLTPAGTYPGLIKTGDNAPIDGTLKTLSDGNGNNLPMSVSTSTINFTGALQQSGVAVPTASQVNAKQDTLVSGTNIKTINSTSLLGSGNIDVVTSPSGSAGYIQFSNGSAFASDANLFWDNTNKRLGIGTTSPTQPLEVLGNALINANAGSDATLSVGNPSRRWDIKAIQSGAYYQVNYQSTGLIGQSIDYQGNVAFGNFAQATARVHIKGSGSTSATTSLLVQNSGGSNAMQIWDDGQILLGYIRPASTLMYLTGSSALRSDGRISVGTTSIDNSAQLQADSTTRGFLPPRMTTTQKNAISSPASGLVVYDTTTNKLCCYNGTSWNDLF
jgi:hypothetical protein